MKNKKITNIVFSALFTAIICILSQIAFATPTIPLTLQTFGIALCGYMLSVKWSLCCTMTYILLGALGLPVFSNFRGGAHIILGPTGGFIIGFILLTFACALTNNAHKRVSKIIISSVGLLLCHILGVIQYSILTGNNLFYSILTVSLPFIFKDIISLFTAFFAAKYLEKRIKGFKS